MMNKKGGILPRDIMFMVIIFGGIMALMSVFVLDMSTTYGNNNLTTEYNALGVSTIGDIVSDNVTTTVQSQRDATESLTEGKTGVIAAIGKGLDIIQGAAKILLGVFNIPSIVDTALDAMFGSEEEVPLIIKNIITVMILGLLSVAIIFGIISALLKGGKL